MRWICQAVKCMDWRRCKYSMACPAAIPSRWDRQGALILCVPDRGMLCAVLRGGLSLRMAGLPIIGMAVAALLVGLLRRRSARTQWILSMAMAAGLWLAILLLSFPLPMKLEISVWQPQELFPSSVALVLDSTAWPFVYAAGTLLMSMVFTAAARTAEAPAGVRAFWFLYTAFAMLAMTAGNMMTLALAWASLDLLTLLFLLSMADQEKERAQVLSRALADAAGVLLLLAAAIVPEGVRDPSITEAMSQPLAAALLILSVFIRLGLVPLHLKIAPVEKLRKGLGTLIRLYPPAIALVLLARILEIGLPSPVVPWVRGVGILAALLGSVRWLLQRDAIEARPYWILALAGLSLLWARSSGEAGRYVVAVGLLVLLVGGALSLFESVSPAHRALPILMGILTAGPPMTPAAILMGGLGESLLKGTSMLLPVVALISMAMIALGCLHLLFQPTASWPTAEPLARVTCNLGMVLPLMTLIGVGIWMKTGISPWGGVAFGVELIAAGLIFAGLRRLRPDMVERARGWIDVLDTGILLQAFVSAVRGTSRLVRPIAQLFEGESAMLWLFVIVLLVLMAPG